MGETARKTNVLWRYNSANTVPLHVRRLAMEYRKFADTYYVRLDRGDEVISSLLGICAAEHLGSATFSGIGGCSEAQIQTFIPETGTFETQTLSGMLELVSLTGNVVSGDDGELFHHTHALFSYNHKREYAILFP